MACCYIAASMIAFIIKSCEMLDINLQLQYNDAAKVNYGQANDVFDQEKGGVQHEAGVTIISISGMTCAACTTTVEKALMGIKGVKQALVSLPYQEARVFHDEDIDRNDLKEAIEAVGYDATLGERNAPQKVQTLRHTEEIQELRRSLKGLGWVSTVIFGLGYGLNWMGLSSYFSHPIMSTLRNVILFGLTIMAASSYGGWIFGHAWTAAKRGRVNMHTLISVSTAVGLSLTLLNMVQRKGNAPVYFDTIVGILMIISIGRYMDLLSRRRAADTFVGLYSLLDETSSVQLAKTRSKVPTDILRHGDEIIIEPFNVVPCDCYVVEGTSHVNEAVITGESFPKTKTVGQLLLAGSRNGPNQLIAMVNQDYQVSFLSQLIKSIEGSLTAKASAHHRVDIITQYFVSTIFAIAVATAAITFTSNQPTGLSVALDAAGRRTMTILAAACPCALGLATPCAVMAGIDVAWRKGIVMLEGGETMEQIRDVTHIVMDKTGTLTQGTPTVTNILMHGRWKDREQELAVLICAAEEGGMSAHPLALAIFRKMLGICGEVWKDFHEHGSVQNVEETHGRGVSCQVNSGNGKPQMVALGNLQYMRDKSIKDIDKVPHDLDAQGSVVWAAVDGEVAATLVLQDTVRTDAKSTIDDLKKRGLEVSMLTGDNAQEAARISQQLGISVTASAATPDVKLEHVKELQRKGRKVIMVCND